MCSEQSYVVAVNLPESFLVALRRIQPRLALICPHEKTAGATSGVENYIVFVSSAPLCGISCVLLPIARSSPDGSGEILQLLYEKEFGLPREYSVRRLPREHCVWLVVRLRSV